MSELRMIGNDPTYFGLGYVDALDQPTMGAIVFCVETEKDDAGDHLVLVIKSLFVEPEHRMEGIGIILLRALLKVGFESDAEAVRADVPLGLEYNDICYFLYDTGFEFNITELFEVTFNLGDILKNPALKSGQTMAKPLRDVTQQEYYKTLEYLRGIHDLSEMDISDKKSDYDEDVSSILLEKGQPPCLYLVKSLANGQLKPVLLRLGKNGGALQAAQLLACSAGEGEKKYPADTPIRIKCYDERDAQLINHIFPQARPLIVRRGYFYL